MSREIKKNYTKSRRPVKRMTRLQRRKQLARRRRICWIGTLLLVLAILVIRFTPMFTEVNAETATVTKYYTSIEIQPGDTLSGIAAKYCTIDQISPSDYVREVENMNHLDSDKITAGMKLCIPYYVTELEADSES